jgi:hypothetical protein
MKFDGFNDKILSRDAKDIIENKLAIVLAKLTIVVGNYMFYFYFIEQKAKEDYDKLKEMEKNLE